MSLKNLYTPELLSQYRTTLMGIAMVWVVLHHCNCNTHYELNFLYSFPLLNLGYSGVDIFIFLSGFGIYCSLNKVPDIGVFLLKRIKRFIPAIPIFILYILYKKITSLHVIAGFFTLENYWIRDSFLAYLSYAFLFYLFSPLIKDIIDKHIKQNARVFLLFLFVLFILTIPYWNTSQLSGISRILIYTLGMYLGYFYCNNISLNKKLIPLSFILSILGFISLIFVFIKFTDIRMKYGFIWYLNLFFIPGLCYALIFIINKTEKYIGKLLNIFNVIGKYSLTVYCIDFYITTCIKFDTFMVHFFLSLVLGIVYGLIVNMCLKRQVYRV